MKGMTTPALLRSLVSGADASGDAVRRWIKAYHGSPHSFDRFDASKIGTGEGAQSYGHGLYFAGNEAVARTYRDILGGRRDVFIGDDSAIGLNQTLREGPAFNTPRTPKGNAIRALMAGAYGVDSVEEVLRNARHYASDNTPAMSAAVNAALDELAARGLRLGPQPGHMYAVEIDYPEEALLDWDKPVGGAIASRLDSRMAGDLAAEAQRMAGMGQLPRHMQVLNRIASGEPGLATGEMVYRAAGRFDPPASRPGWGSVTNTINDSVTNQARASERLLDAGIPGIRYLDGGSRAASEGTRNYVIFPGAEDRIRILRKYGLLAPMGAGLMGEEE